VYVQFMLDAPGASSVSVAGDFSEWEPSFTLEDVDGDGVWTGRVPVQPGVHTYMFLIDGTEWRTDPRADRYRDDGFGNRNAVLAVASGA
jgi:1,4-alpha-glucan branching enzyme